ncbi:MAG: hypothetical protein ACKESB_03465 [Candidatus Hodgkinia cicadicola]
MADGVDGWREGKGGVEGGERREVERGGWSGGRPRGSEKRKKEEGGGSG